MNELCGMKASPDENLSSNLVGTIPDFLRSQQARGTVRKQRRLHTIFMLFRTRKHFARRQLSAPLFAGEFHDGSPNGARVGAPARIVSHGRSPGGAENILELGRIGIRLLSMLMMVGGCIVIHTQRVYALSTSAALTLVSVFTARAHMNAGPRGKLSLIKPPLTPNQQRDEGFKAPPSTKSSSSNVPSKVAVKST